MNLTTNHVINTLETQGRYANGSGQEYATAYRVLYWRDGLQRFREYRDSLGRVILPGNKDTNSVARNFLNPPIVASAIRIVPYSNHSRTVCLRMGIRGCPFSESVESYNVPQGMVRGATLELLDITYDGLEDPVTGYLRGGLGQLVDGKYGAEDFRAFGENGVIRGYEWVGWKNKTMGPLQMDFTFKNIRQFQSVIIHINNHYTRDIQIFSRAKIYFSNEEGKFGDDRAVDYLYMPDAMVEDARNVSINLHEEHGKFVMIQLFFAAKWILISEITFVSEEYEEKLFSTESTSQAPASSSTVAVPVTTVTHPSTVTTQASVHTVQEQSQAEYVGLVIGILLTVIILLIVATFLVILRIRRGKYTPTHSLVGARIQDRINFPELGTPYRAKMRVYGQVSAREEGGCTMYSSELPSGPALSDCTDDYAEPVHPPTMEDNIYSQAFHPPDHPPLIQYSPPSYPPPIMPYPPNHYEDGLACSQIPYGSSLSSPSSVDILYTSKHTQEYHPIHHSGSRTPKYSKVNKSEKSKPKEHKQDSYDRKVTKDSISKSQKKSLSIVNPDMKLKAVKNCDLKIVERLGRGKYGEVHLCHYLGSSSSALVSVKSLDRNCSSDQRQDFEADAYILSGLDDPNVACVVGVNISVDPWFIVREFSDQGDLTQYLQDHVAESSLSTPSTQTISYGALLFMATQVASGMKYFATLQYIHKDLATRNCLVYPGFKVKIADCGAARSAYNCDYYSLGVGEDHQEDKIPIRWMAWEALLLGAYTTKSDVWAFGVTLWEILTFAREQPYEGLSDNQVIENLSELSAHGSLLHQLPQPYNCPRDVFDLMVECWHKEAQDRPGWAEILLFLQRKNLGFEPPE